MTFARLCAVAAALGVLPFAVLAALAASGCDKSVSGVLGPLSISGCASLTTTGLCSLAHEIDLAPGASTQLTVSLVATGNCATTYAVGTTTTSATGPPLLTVSASPSSLTLVDGISQTISVSVALSSSATAGQSLAFTLGTEGDNDCGNVSMNFTVVATK